MLGFTVLYWGQYGHDSSYKCNQFHALFLHRPTKLPYVLSLALWAAYFSPAISITPLPSQSGQVIHVSTSFVFTFTTHAPLHLVQVISIFLVNLYYFL
jgi:hypothetical protein